jgi:hypothetical protein
MSQHDIHAVESRAPVYLVIDGQILLDAPVKEAWRHIIDYPSWQNYSTVEHISGEVGEAGEVVLLKKEEAGIEFPPYYARTIKIEPESRVICKCYPQDESDAFFGIVEFRAAPVGDRTRFSWSGIYEFMVAYSDPEQLKAFEAEEYQNFEKLFDSVLPKLQRLVRQSAVGARTS